MRSMDEVEVQRGKLWGLFLKKRQWEQYGG